MTAAASERLAAAAGASLDLTGHAFGRAEKLWSDAQSDARAVARDLRRLALAAGSLRDLFRGVPRLTRIFTTAGRLAAAYRIQRARAAAGPAGRGDEALEPLHREGAERLYDLCVELGGGVLKVGQFLSCRADLLPAAYVDRLATLRDRVPPVSSEAIVARIEQELGRPLEELFSDFDPEPLATASLAQVHRARLPGGAEVAVKVQLPGVEKQVALDLAALRLLAPLLADALPGSGAATALAELSRAVREELDFEGEAESLRAIAGGCAGDRRVIVPRLYPELSSARVLTMELVRGEPLSDYLDRADAGERAALFETLIDVLCAQVLRLGVFQGDPHPGNFLVVPGPAPRLALLDFGCVARLDDKVRRAYAQVAGAFLAGDRDRVAALLADLGFAGDGDDPDALAAAADVFLEGFRDPAALSLMIDDPRAAFARALSTFRERPVAQVPGHFVLLSRLFGTVGGLLLSYGARIDLFSLLSRHAH